MTKKNKVTKKTARKQNSGIPLSTVTRERIKKLVAGKRLSRSEIATRCKVSLGTVAKYARAKTAATPPTNAT